MGSSLELIGVAIVFFIAFLYLPTALFRFSAEWFIDLAPAPDKSELEEFITAAMPAPLFHAIAWVAMRVVHQVTVRIKAHEPHLPIADWQFIGAILTGGNNDYVLLHVGQTAKTTGSYLACVLVVSAITGLMYGTSFLDRVRGLRWYDRIPIPKGAPDRSLAWRAARWLGYGPWLFAWTAREFAYGITFGIANLFYREQAAPLFRWAVQKPPVIVRTRTGRVYFGYFYRYEKKRSGDIDTFTITRPHRYCFDATHENISAGKLPFSDFGGSLTLLWSEVADIHEASETHYQNLVARYVEERRVYLSGRVLELCCGESLTYTDVYTRIAGGTYFDAEILTAALERLLGHGLARITGSSPDLIFHFANTKSGNTAWKSDIALPEQNPTVVMDSSATPATPDTPRLPIIKREEPAASSGETLPPMSLDPGLPMVTIEPAPVDEAKEKESDDDSGT